MTHRKEKRYTPTLSRIRISFIIASPTPHSARSNNKKVVRSVCFILHILLPVCQSSFHDRQIITSTKKARPWNTCFFQKNRLIIIIIPSPSISRLLSDQKPPVRLRNQPTNHPQQKKQNFSLPRRRYDMIYAISRNWARKKLALVMAKGGGEKKKARGAKRWMEEE